MRKDLPIEKALAHAPSEAQSRGQQIVIEPTTIRGKRGQYYRVYFRDGVLIEHTSNPEFEACRALVARGVTGRLEVWRAGAPCPAMVVPDIERAATRTVKRTRKSGPDLPRGRPYLRIWALMPLPVTRCSRQRPKRFWMG